MDTSNTKEIGESERAVYSWEVKEVLPCGLENVVEGDYINYKSKKPCEEAALTGLLEYMGERMDKSDVIGGQFFLEVAGPGD